VEDSLDSLLEDAGLEGTVSEDGKRDTFYCSVVRLCFATFSSVQSSMIDAFCDLV